MHDSWVTEKQWTQLDAARQLRPKPIGALPVILTIALALGAVGTAIWALFGNASGYYSLGLGVSFVVAVRWPGQAARAWLTRFNGAYADHERMVATLPGSGQAPTLSYEMLRPEPAWECLRIDLPRVSALSIRPNGWPIGDPLFDRDLGLDASTVTRALLGGALRKGLLRWHAESRLVVADGTVVLHVGAQGYDIPSVELDEICELFQAFTQRVNGRPMTGLTAIARDLGHPFDAARALALLVEDWPTQAETVTVALTDDPVGAVLARVATTGEGLLDPALDWPTRSAIGRGILGARGSAQETFVGWLHTQSPTDADHAMLLVELCEAAHGLNGDQTSEAQAVDAEAYVVAHGGPAALAWLRGRTHLDSARRSLDVLSARLRSQRGGLLSLDEGVLSGGLSETRGGDLSPASPDP